MNEKRIHAEQELAVLHTRLADVFLSSHSVTFEYYRDHTTFCCNNCYGWIRIHRGVSKGIVLCIYKKIVSSKNEPTAQVFFFRQ